MARIRLKLGGNEIEVDSRDFYVDNQTLGEVIGSLAGHLPENKAEIVHGTGTVPETLDLGSAKYGLGSLDDAEVFEPEFSEPKRIKGAEIKHKLRILETGRFFDSPRTVSETVERLRECGWAAGPLDVSKVLAKMASNKEIMKNSGDSRTQYFAKGQIVA